jgi:hypothetical protein
MQVRKTVFLRSCHARTIEEAGAVEIDLWHDATMPRGSAAGS